MPNTYNTVQSNKVYSILVADIVTDYSGGWYSYII